MMIHVVHFNPEGDGVTALYIDGVEHKHGDYYHDKIDDWINGFVAGVEHCEVAFTREDHSVPGEKCKPIWEGGNSPPAKWPDKKYYKHRNVE